MRLRRYILSRILQLIPVILTVIVINFLLIYLAPGDVASTLAGEDADPQYMEEIRKVYGLDKPFHVQLLRYLGQVIKGDLGRSYRSREPVLVEIMRRVPATLMLVGSSLLIALFIGTWAGTMVARRPGSLLDSTVSTFAVAAYSIPVFWLGLMLVLFFGVYLKWLPISGMYSLMVPKEGLAKAFDVFRHLILPSLALSTVWIGQYVRLSRTSVAAVYNEQYITTVRAIGFPSRTILLHYALRNALLPVVTIFGLQMGLVLTGAVLTETVFSWPGLGRLIYDAILARDTPIIMGAYVAMSVFVALASLITDLLYAVLDPRVEL